jgi:hypothetical protein
MIVNGVRLPKGFAPLAVAKLDLTSKNKDGMVILTPTRPATAEAVQMNRKAIGAVLRKAEKTRVLTLDDALGFVRSTEKAPDLNDIDGLYLISTRRFGLEALAAGPRKGFLFLKFYSSLQPSQVRALEQGFPLIVTDLSPTQREFLLADLLRSDEGPYREIAGYAGKPTEPPLFLTAGKISLPRSLVGNSISSELLPNGLPKETHFYATVSSDEALLGIHPADGVESLQFPSVLVMQKAREELGFPADVRVPTKFLPLSQRKLSLRFEFGTGVKMRRAVASFEVPHQTSEVDYKDLPIRFRQAVEEQVERYRDSLKASPPVLPNQKKAPP